MKAWVLHGIGDFRLEEADEPVLAKGEVLVSVKAAGMTRVAGGPAPPPPPPVLHPHRCLK